MPVYRYKGVAAGNRAVRATIDAESVRAARTQLRAEGIYPTEIAEGATRSGVGDTLSKLQLPTIRRVPDLDLALFSSQLATLLTAGVPLVQGLAALTEQVENDRLRSVVGRVREAVNQGSSLAEALREYPQIFDDLYCSMVESGESSGALGLVLNRLGSYVEGRMELRNKLINAMVYPVLMLGASAAVTAVLLVYVIPNVAGLLQDMNAALPLPTRIVMGLSDFLTTSWIYLGMFVCGAVLIGNRLVHTQRGRWAWDRTKLRLPVLGRLVRFVAISRFSRTLSTLVGGSLNIVNALDISKNVSGNVVIGAAIDNARSALTKGSSLAAPLRQSGEFPPLVTHMISVGEASGELDSMLERVSDTYDKLVDNALQRMLALMGPLLLMVVAGLILMIILSTLLPLLSLTSAL